MNIYGESEYNDKRNINDVIRSLLKDHPMSELQFHMQIITDVVEVAESEDKNETMQ